MNPRASAGVIELIASPMPFSNPSKLHRECHAVDLRVVTKYRFPGKRIHDGVVLEFRKQLLVYNARRIRAPVEDLVVVQGFPGAWWCHQHDVTAVVALMGWPCSAEQAEVIVDLERFSPAPSASLEIELCLPLCRSRQEEQRDNRSEANRP